MNPVVTRMSVAMVVAVMKPLVIMIPMKSLRSGSHSLKLGLNLLLLLNKHLKAHLMTMIVVTVWMTSILLLMTMSVQSRFLLLHQHPKEIEASIMQVAAVSPALVMKTIKSAGQNAFWLSLCHKKCRPNIILS